MAEREKMFDVDEALDRLTEEASELVQAAVKARRVFGRPEDYTIPEFMETVTNLMNKVGDVQNQGYMVGIPMLKYLEGFGLNLTDRGGVKG